MNTSPCNDILIVLFLIAAATFTDRLFKYKSIQMWEIGKKKSGNTKFFFCASSVVFVEISTRHLFSCLRDHNVVQVSDYRCQDVPWLFDRSPPLSSEVVTEFTWKRDLTFTSDPCWWKTTYWQYSQSLPLLIDHLLSILFIYYENYLLSWHQQWSSEQS